MIPDMASNDRAHDHSVGLRLLADAVEIVETSDYKTMSQEEIRESCDGIKQILNSHGFEKDNEVALITSRAAEAIDALEIGPPKRCSTPKKLYSWDGEEGKLDMFDIDGYLVKKEDVATTIKQEPTALEDMKEEEIEDKEINMELMDISPVTSDNEGIVFAPEEDSSVEEYSSCDDDSDELRKMEDDDTFDRRPLKNDINETYLFTRTSRVWAEIKACREQQTKREKGWRTRTQRCGPRRDPRKVYLHSKCGHMHRPSSPCPMLGSVEHCYATGKEVHQWCDECRTYWDKGAAHFCAQPKCATCRGGKFRFENQNPEVFGLTRRIQRI